jgi:hypothetical protein
MFGSPCSRFDGLERLAQQHPQRAARGGQGGGGRDEIAHASDVDRIVRTIVRALRATRIRGVSEGGPIERYGDDRVDMRRIVDI